jgi:ATP phosphoribosyltransferase regulatory subunit
VSSLLNDTKRLPEGVQDIHSPDLELKEKMIDTLKKLYRSYGYSQVQTPIFEYYDLFLEINGTINRENMVKLVDRDGKILVLRPDATIPIARMVATFRDREDAYYKLSYVTNIFRMNEEKHSLSNREMTQAGIEFFGNDSMEADIEVISLAIKSLQKLGIQDFKIDIGQANYFRELINEATLSKEQQAEIRRKIERKNVSELKEILSTLNLDENYKRAILSMPLLYGEPSEVIRKAEQLALNDKMREELQYVECVYERLVDFGFGNYLSIDLGLINDLNYYTGIIFQGFMKNYGKPIVQGGRYDQLTKHFGAPLPATGFGLYLDEVLTFLREDLIEGRQENKTDVMVLYSDETRIKALTLADDLRTENLIVETDKTREGINSKDIFFKRGIPLVVYVHEEGYQILSQNGEITCLQAEDVKKNILKG